MSKVVTASAPGFNWHDRMLRSPLRSATGLEIGTEWLGQTSPALPLEHPDASAGPRSSSVTRAPRRASSSAEQTPIAPPPTTITSSTGTA